MLRTSLDLFRLVGWLEGASYLLLLGVAMPLKYLAGMPEVVSVVGTAHGVLFVAYVLGAIYTTSAQRWPLTHFVWAVIASVLPFGPFVFERYLLSGEA